MFNDFMRIIYKLTNKYMQFNCLWSVLIWTCIFRLSKASLHLTTWCVENDLLSVHKFANVFEKKPIVQNADGAQEIKKKFEEYALDAVYRIIIMLGIDKLSIKLYICGRNSINPSVMIEN